MNTKNKNFAIEAKLDNNRKILSKYSDTYNLCSFYFFNHGVITNVHLSLEAVEAMRLLIIAMQEEMAKKKIAYTIMTKSFVPKGKTGSAKKAGCSGKTKKRPSKSKSKK